MVVIMIIAMFATVVMTGPGDYVSTDKDKTPPIYESPGSIRR